MPDVEIAIGKLASPHEVASESQAGFCMLGRAREGRALLNIFIANVLSHPYLTTDS